MPNGFRRAKAHGHREGIVASHVRAHGGNQDFAVIRSKGDQALFGKSTQAMKVSWKVPDNRPLGDFVPTIILKAKDFAADISIYNSREGALTSETAISREHVTNNEAVRKTLLDRGIRPKSLPAVEDVKKGKAPSRV